MKHSYRLLAIALVLVGAGIFSFSTNTAFGVNGCPGSSIPASDGYCYPPSDYDPFDLCIAGYNDYCVSEAEHSAWDDALDTFQYGDCESYGSAVDCENGDTSFEGGPDWNYIYYGDGEPCGYEQYQEFMNSRLTTYQTIPEDECPDDGGSGGGGGGGGGGATLKLNASPKSISSGGSTVLTWTVSGSTCSGATASATPSNGQWSGSKNGNIGTRTQTITNLTQTTQFRLRCNSGLSDGTTVSVGLYTDMDIEATPNQVVREGTEARLEYNTGGRPSCTVSSPLPAPWDSWSVTGSGVEEPLISGFGDVVFTLTCGGTPAADPVTTTVRVLPLYQEF